MLVCIHLLGNVPDCGRMVQTACWRHVELRVFSFSRDKALIGRQLNHYKVLSPLGKGGMGEVYLAEDLKLHRKVALKVLPSEMAADPDRLARFQREARAVAALNHPNIITIYSVEEADSIHFLTMELVEGGSLSEHV